MNNKADRITCCYPDCFNCPYADCINDVITADEGLNDELLGVVITYYSQHRQEVLEKAKEYRQKNGDVMRSRERERYAKLPAEEKQKIVDRNRANYWKNPEEARRKKREYYQRRKELAKSTV